MAGSHAGCWQVDFDWSNWKGIGASDGWAKAKPMDCEERMVKQVQMTVSASPDTKVFVYRNMIKALRETDSPHHLRTQPCLAAAGLTATLTKGS